MGEEWGYPRSGRGVGCLAPSTPPSWTHLRPSTSPQHHTPTPRSPSHVTMNVRKGRGTSSSAHLVHPVHLAHLAHPVHLALVLLFLHILVPAVVATSTPQLILTATSIQLTTISYLLGDADDPFGDTPVDLTDASARGSLSLPPTTGRNDPWVVDPTSAAAMAGFAELALLCRPLALSYIAEMDPSTSSASPIYEPDAPPLYQFLDSWVVPYTVTPLGPTGEGLVLGPWPGLTYPSSTGTSAPSTTTSTSTSTSTIYPADHAPGGNQPDLFDLDLDLLDLERDVSTADAIMECSLWECDGLGGCVAWASWWPSRDFGDDLLGAALIPVRSWTGNTDNIVVPFLDPRGGIAAEMVLNCPGYVYTVYAYVNLPPVHAHLYTPSPTHTHTNPLTSYPHHPLTLTLITRSPQGVE